MVCRSDAAPAPETHHPAATTDQRPVTRLSQGITKPKTYSDGTVRWCMLGSAAVGELASIEEALGDEKWVTVIDTEHAALLKNKTWHLVPPSKGRNVIGCK